MGVRTCENRYFTPFGHIFAVYCAKLAQPMWLMLCMPCFVLTMHVVLHERFPVVETNTTSLLNGLLDLVVFATGRCPGGGITIIDILTLSM